jgi:hypothetical protein
MNFMGWLGVRSPLGAFQMFLAWRGGTLMHLTGGLGGA